MCALGKGKGGKGEEVFVGEEGGGLGWIGDGAGLAGR